MKRATVAEPLFEPALIADRTQANSRDATGLLPIRRPARQIRSMILTAWICIALLRLLSAWAR
jgi:hypothetical protein